VTAPLIWLACFPEGTFDTKFLATTRTSTSTIRLPACTVWARRRFSERAVCDEALGAADKLAKMGITVRTSSMQCRRRTKSILLVRSAVNLLSRTNNSPIPCLRKAACRPRAIRNVIVREAPDGGTVRVKDVARVELGAQDYSIVSRLNGKPAIVIPVYQLPGSNAVQTAAGVRKTDGRDEAELPQDNDYAISLDQTLAVTEGIKENH